MGLLRVYLVSESTIIDVEATKLHVNYFHYFKMLIREGHISPLNGINYIFIFVFKTKEMQVMKIQELNDVCRKDGFYSMFWF